MIPSVLRVAKGAWGNQNSQANHLQQQVNPRCSPNTITFFVCHGMNEVKRDTTTEVVDE